LRFVSRLQILETTSESLGKNPIFSSAGLRFQPEFRAESPDFSRPESPPRVLGRNDAGLSRELVLYLARHECGTKICREKGIEYARRLLGHANISTTQRYMHLDYGELADAQDLVD
jgi:integrase